MNDENNYIHRYSSPFYHQITMMIYLQDQKMIQRNKEFIVKKNIILDLILNK